jgi:uncharacterized protein with HEPN domain
MRNRVGDRERILHIRDEVEFILKHSSDLDLQKFNSDETLKRALERSLEIIGEAANNVTEDLLLKYPNVHWRRVVNFRNFLAHEYFAIDSEVVFGIIKNNIPELKNEIEEIIKNENF